MPSYVMSEDFVSRYRNEVPPFGFNGLGELVYMRTYSRLKPDGKKERWIDTVRRVVEGTYGVLQQNKPHLFVEAESREMFDKIFRMKFLPPGRGLWAMGTDIVREKGGAALNNCGFISTQSITGRCENPEQPFTFAMDMLMLGVGIGFDTRGAGRALVLSQKDVHYVDRYNIPDTREGWVRSVGLLLRSYLHYAAVTVPVFDYSKIRPAGEKIKIFGGTASGPQCLKDLHQALSAILSARAGQYLSARDIVDIFNLIGVCVVAGNVRRSAELAIGPCTEEFLDLKNYKLHKERAMWGWASNNSILADSDTDYDEVAKRIADNGEPGILWLDNMRNYGRMHDPKNFKDHKAMGGNPCLEQTLESGELCCLVEVFLSKHGTISEFTDTLYYAYLYAKAVTMIPVHNPQTQAIIERNRRIGVSVTGVAQFLAYHSLEELRSWLDVGYSYLLSMDVTNSCAWGIPPSIKLTCVKPSGTVSLLAGATPGMHYPISQHYYRRVRLGKNDAGLAALLRKNGYAVDDDPVAPGCFVATFAVDVGEGVRTLDQVGMWEQVALASFMQAYWADNQVSCTVTFSKSEQALIPIALRFYCYSLKAISFLPRGDDVYQLMPYQRISGEEYRRYAANTKPLRLDLEEEDLWQDAEEERNCDTDSCLVVVE